MIVHFTARQMPLTAEVKQYCEKRLKSLERLMRFVLEVDVVLAAQKNRHKVELHVKAKGAGLVIAEEGAELMMALDQAFDSLEKKLKKEKEKFREKKRRRGREAKSVAVAPVAEEPSAKVIRSEDYSLKPMSVEEAILVLEHTRKDVFVFRQFGSERWTVLYRRKDGHFGLIEPEG